jgi:hypothetical protein
MCPETPRCLCSEPFRVAVNDLVEGSDPKERHALDLARHFLLEDELPPCFALFLIHVRPIQPYNDLRHLDHILLLAAMKAPVCLHLALLGCANSQENIYHFSDSKPEYHSSKE